MNLMPRFGKIVHKVQEFEVYETINGPMLGPVQYHWQLQDNDRSYGPFPSVADAMTHYKGWQAARNATDNVIFVNFKTRKRVSNPNI
jgi:hypothetical protein